MTTFSMQSTNYSVTMQRNATQRMHKTTSKSATRGVIRDEFGKHYKNVEKSLNLTAELFSERVLGMGWNTAADVFIYMIDWNRYDGELLNGARRRTKQEVQRVLMSILDTLGQIAHLLVYLKVFEVTMLTSIPRLELQAAEGLELAHLKLYLIRCRSGSPNDSTGRRILPS